MLEPAKIVTLEEMVRIRPSLSNVVFTSGGYDPIHPGHLSCIVDSKQYGDVLVVVVNGDNFLKTKKGKPFQDLDTRCRIVSYVRGVDYVVAFEVENDQTVKQALAAIMPNVYTKGGDRDETNIPEAPLCKELGIKLVTGVGLGKKWSSSDFLSKWKEGQR